MTHKTIKDKTLKKISKDKSSHIQRISQLKNHNNNHSRIFDISHIPNKKQTKKIINTVKNITKFKSFYKQLNKNEKETLAFYKGFGYFEMNKFLYSNNELNEINLNNSIVKIQELLPAETQNLVNIKSLLVNNIPNAVELFINKFIVEKINTIDKIFALPNTYKLDKETILYRGNIGLISTIGKNTKIGNEILFKNFLSTSYDISVALDFTGVQNDIVCCLYILSGLENVPYVFIPWKLHNNFKNIKIPVAFYDESEYLLPRNLKFKVKKIEKRILNISNQLPQKIYKNISVNSLDKILQKNKMTNKKEAIEKNLGKFMRDIKIFHLEYIGQEPIEPISPYKYNETINLKVYNTRQMDLPNL